MVWCRYRGLRWPPFCDGFLGPGVVGTVCGLQRAEIEAFGLCSDSVVVKSCFEDAFEGLHCRECESDEQYTDDDADDRHDQEEQVSQEWRRLGLPGYKRA